MSKGKEQVDKVKEGVSDVKKTVKEEPHNVKRTIGYKLKKNIHLILLGGTVALFGFFYFFGGVEIPEAVVIAFFVILISSFLMYPYAVRVVDWFVDDNRKPYLDIEDIEDDLGIYLVPDERTGEIEIEDGRPIEWKTSMGIGREVRQFREEISEDGRSTLTAKATWEGSKSPLQLKREYSDIDAMRDELEPWARKGFLYETKLPHIIHKVQSQTGNDLIYQFQELVNFNGGEIHESVQQMVDETRIEDETSDEDSEDEDLEKLAEMLNGDMEKILNGDGNGE